MPFLPHHGEDMGDTIDAKGAAESTEIDFSLPSRKI